MTRPLDRRAFMASSAAAALAGPALAQAPGAEDAKLHALMDRIFQARIDESPGLATSLGLDTGARAPLKARLDQRTEAERQAQLRRDRERLAAVKAIRREALNGASKVDYDTLVFQYASAVADAERFSFGATGSRFIPYVISQNSGAYQSTPDFLDNQHRVTTRADAEAYLSRLKAFAVVMDQDIVRTRADVAKGVLSPKFNLETALGQMRAARGRPASETTLVQSLARKAQAAKVEGDWARQAEQIVTSEVFPAYDRQIALMEELIGKADDRAGVWKLPDAEAYYAAALESATTTKLSSAEIHKMGLDQVAELTARMDAILKAQGMSQGTVAERVTALSERPEQLYPDTAAGREALIASLNAQIVAIRAKLPAVFNRLPKSAVEVKAVPVEIQDGASNGYYNRAPLDGSRPAIYWINLKDVRDWPKFSLPSLTYHEALPGHHLQLGLIQENEAIPLLRRTGGFSANTEGWALYAEQLVDEMGVYENDPLGKLGFLQSFLFRAARLVIDTGMHDARWKWSREQATDYMVQSTGFARPRSQREVERYCSWPGQATSYKIGQTVWVAQRDRAKAALGARFDLKHFHDAALAPGFMPMTVLENLVSDYIARTA